MSLRASTGSLSCQIFFFMVIKKTTLDVFNTASKVYPRGIISTYYARKKRQDIMQHHFPEGKKKKKTVRYRGNAWLQNCLSS